MTTFANRLLLTTLLVFATTAALAQENTRWTIQSDGAIAWTNFEGDAVPHDDHIEASGERVSTVLRYRVDANGAFSLNRSIVWPMLRTIPNNTHASLTIRFEDDPLASVTVDGAKAKSEKTTSITLDGFLTVASRVEYGDGRALLTTRKVFPSTKNPFVCERVAIKNVSDRDVLLAVPEMRRVSQTDKEKGVNGSYTIVEKLSGAGERKLAPNEETSFDFSIQGFSEEKGESEQTPDFDAEERARKAFVEEMWTNLVLETPEPVLDRAFAFAKIRASESIYRTKGGLMHGPGGESYYAAIWANDQAEYVNPFFPYLGYATGNESALNSYRHFARFMNDEYKPIPSSIIAEGIDIWNGAGDRGDAAMIAYGAARYALVRADESEARELWPLVEWCLEYCKRKLTSEGVVASRCDELEGRFPAGNANLSTSTLYYDALISATYLGKELGVDRARLDEYAREATTLRANIDKYFGAEVGGFETYQYFDGCKLLRSWICVPLVAGIDDRAQGTIEALFSDKLWTPNGLLTQEGTKTFWDRSTLYALRGVFAVGATERALEHLRRYSTARLLGEHVPYPIEAWPEGSQRHLSAESGLYCRIYTEGVFGIRPTGFSTFTLAPRLPKEWDQMKLGKVRGFGTTFDIVVKRAAAGDLTVTIARENSPAIVKTIRDGDSVEIDVRE